jgi:hypothetical protein
VPGASTGGDWFPADPPTCCSACGLVARKLRRVKKEVTTSVSVESWPAPSSSSPPASPSSTCRGAKGGRRA